MEMQMEQADKGCLMIKTGVSECFFRYRLTWIVPDKGL